MGFIPSPAKLLNIYTWVCILKLLLDILSDRLLLLHAVVKIENRNFVFPG